MRLRGWHFGKSDRAQEVRAHRKNGRFGPQNVVFESIAATRILYYRRTHGCFTSHDFKERKEIWNFQNHRSCEIRPQQSKISPDGKTGRQDKKWCLWQEWNHLEFEGLYCQRLQEHQLHEFRRSSTVCPQTTARNCDSCDKPQTDAEERRHWPWFFILHWRRGTTPRDWLLRRLRCVQGKY